MAEAHEPTSMSDEYLLENASTHSSLLHEELLQESTRMLENVKIMMSTPSVQKTNMVCCAIEMIYRCSSSARERSYSEIGPELVKVLLKVVRICEESNDPKCEEIVNNILLVFQYFSKVTQVSISLMNLPGVLST